MSGVPRCDTQKGWARHAPRVATPPLQLFLNQLKTAEIERRLIDGQAADGHSACSRCFLHFEFDRTINRLLRQLQESPFGDGCLISIGPLQREIDVLTLRAPAFKQQVILFTLLEAEPGSPQFYTPEFRPRLGDSDH